MEGKETLMPVSDKNICVECGVEIVDVSESAALYECERCVGTNED